MPDPFESLPGRPVKDEDPFASLPGRPVQVTPPDGLKETMSDAAVGLGTGASFDMDDELVGAAHAAAKALGMGSKGYTESRDEYRGRKKLAHERSPVINTAGQLVGGAATSLVGAPEAGLLKIGGRLLGEGAVQGFGASEAENASGLAKDTALGAGANLALGGALHGVIKGGGKALGWTGRAAEEAAPSLADQAARSRVAAAGLNDKALASIHSPDPHLVQDAAQRELGIGGPIAGPAKILGQAKQAISAQEAKRAALAAEFDKAGVKADGARLANKLRRRADELEGQTVKRAKPGADDQEIEALARGKSAQGRIKARGMRKQVDALAETAVPGEATDLNAAAAAAEIGGKRAANKLDRANAPQLETLTPGLDPGGPKLLRKMADYYETRGQVPFGELNGLKQEWAKGANFSAESVQAKVKQDVHKILNQELKDSADALHPAARRALDDAGNPLPKDITAPGSQWARAGQLEHHAILAREGADKALNKQARAGVLSLQGMRKLVGGRDISAVGSLQQGASHVLDKAGKPLTTMGRILERKVAPVTPGLSKLMTSALVGPHVQPHELEQVKADEGVAKVQQAPAEEQAQTHFLESHTNPAYRRAALDDEDQDQPVTAEPPGGF